jgi:peptide/nickel transport system substrate-binding protein
MTAADIPRTLGQPDQGFEGNRFTGIPIYDSLTQWDLSVADGPSTLIPGVATSWAVDPDDTTKWIFKLREGVTFHDGSPFNAEAVVWNVQKVSTRKRAAFRRQPGRRHRVAHADPALGPRHRRHDGRADHLRARQRSCRLNLTNLFMASPSALAGEVRGDRQRRGGLDGLRRRPFGLGPLPGHRLHPARAARARRQPRLLGREAHARRSTASC